MPSGHAARRRRRPGSLAGAAACCMTSAEVDDPPEGKVPCPEDHLPTPSVSWSLPFGARQALPSFLTTNIHPSAPLPPPPPTPSTTTSIHQLDPHCRTTTRFGRRNTHPRLFTTPGSTPPCDREFATTSLPSRACCLIATLSPTKRPSTINQPDPTISNTASTTSWRLS